MKELIAMAVSFLAVTSARAEEPMIVSQDFASLFNQFRYAQPAEVPWAGSYFAYAHNGIGVGIENGYGIKEKGEKSASYFYDQLYNNGQLMAHDYEVKNHSCDNLDPSLKDGCESWWGHCNGWSAAAIKEKEPRETLDFRGKSFEVGHQKALLTELWLTANSSFIGNTQKRRETGAWIYDNNDPDAKAFWDVTPRQAALTFMNQVGAMKTGIVVDRFTGEQVWNQPIVGYRFLPIRLEDLGKQNFQGKEFYYAQLRMKIFWANDNVLPGHISNKFSIQETSDEEYSDNLPPDYAQRLLKFKLFFDAPLVVDSTGTKIQSSGRIVGDGLWDAQENPVSNPIYLNQSHPDFIWQPQSAYIDFSRGYGNPYIGVEQIHEVAMASRTPTPPPAPQPPPVPQPPPAPPRPVTPPRPPSRPQPPPITPSVSSTKFVVEVSRTNVYEGDNALIAERLILRIFNRANLGMDVNEKDIQFSGKNIIFKAYSGSSISRDAIKRAIEDAGAKPIRIDPL